MSRFLSLFFSILMSTGNVCYLFAFRFYQGALEIIVKFPNAYQYFMKCCFSSVHEGVGLLALGTLLQCHSPMSCHIPPLAPCLGCAGRGVPYTDTGSIQVVLWKKIFHLSYQQPIKCSWIIKAQIAVLVVLCMGVGCPPFSWFCVVSLTGTCSADCVLAAIVLVWMLAIEKWFGCACSRVLPSLLLTFQFHVKFLFLLLGYLPCFWFTPPKTQMCQTLLLLMNDKPVELIAVLLRKKT